jgi:Uma2 family endonuclease
MPRPNRLNVAIPPLEPGDRLTREEFERRYDAMPNLKKAELIEGVVYMPSPVRLDRHGSPHSDLVTWIGVYKAATPGVKSADNTTVRLDDSNEPQPDALLMIDPARGGQAHISDDDYVETAPELVAEVSASSASYDLHTKLEAYRRNGVREYVVWRVLDGEVDWFVLRGGQYERLAAGADGILRSEVFPGLWLDASALVNDDLARVLAVVQQGVASSEHAAFVARMNAAAAAASDSGPPPASAGGHEVRYAAPEGRAPASEKSASTVYPSASKPSLIKP